MYEKIIYKMERELNAKYRKRNTIKIFPNKSRN